MILPINSNIDSIALVFISGCYTMINHPEVEIYYERENGEEYLAEDYDVFVDEDCSTCHEEFHHHRADDLPAYLNIFIK